MATHPADIEHPSRIAVVERILLDSAKPQPTADDQIIAAVSRMGITRQAMLIQAITQSPLWGEMDYEDSQKLDEIMARFVHDSQLADWCEDRRMHGDEVRA